MKQHLGLFEGIGGFSIAARWMGWNTAAWCEWNEFCQKVLRYHFPEAEAYSDINNSDFIKYANRIYILTGGFPCQPFSTAGEQLGTDDPRYMWPQMLRTIRQVRPRWVVGENVFGLVSWNGGLVFEKVQSDLEAAGYEVFAFILPACAKDAPHRRERVWFIAYSNGNGKPDGTIYERKGNRVLDPFTNAPGIRCNRNDRQRKKREQRRPGRQALYQFNGVSRKRFASNSNPTEQQRRPEEGKYLQKQPSGFTEFAGTFFADWEKFPTQPPVCSGNDGLSDRLDGITFSKLRTESIKAYGNAIVPHVAFEIFKAIEAYDKLNYGKQ